MLDPEWLAKTIEPALEPELPIIDPHNHLWDMDPESWGRYLADDDCRPSRQRNRLR